MSDHGEFGLVMPFVACASQGGPYEDQAFVAGYSAGSVDAILGLGMVQVFTETVRTDLLPQLDLIAMRRGFTMDRVQMEGGPDEWTMVVFTRTDDRL